MVNKSWTFSGGGTRALLVVASLFLFVIAHAFAAEPRRVLIIHAFGHAYSPWSDIAASFRAELIKNTKEPIDLYEVSLDTARVQSREDETPFVDYIHALLGGRKLDLIVPIGAPSAFFMQRNRQRIFPAAPMLIVGADRRRIPDYSLTENDATVLIDVNLPGYLANILRVRPETTEIAVVVGNSPVERYWTSELRRDFQPLAGRVKIDWLNDLTFGEMLNARPQCRRQVRFLVSAFRGRSGRSLLTRQRTRSHASDCIRTNFRKWRLSNGPRYRRRPFDANSQIG